MKSKLSKIASIGAFSLAAAYGTQSHAFEIDISGGFVGTIDGVNVEIPARELDGVPDPLVGGTVITDNGVGFSNPAVTSGNATAPDGTFTNIEWVVLDPAVTVSELDIVNNPLGESNVVNNDGDTATIANFIQTNRVIPFSDGVAWDGVLELFNVTVSDGTDVVASGELSSTLNFVETDNEPPVGVDCSFGNPTGSGVDCDDRYEVIFDVGVPITWMDDDFNYTLAFDVVAAPGTIADDPTAPRFIYTPEVGASQVDVIARLEAVAKPQIPEPATLSLIGLGLAGLGFAARKKKQQS